MTEPRFGGMQQVPFGDTLHRLQQQLLAMQILLVVGAGEDATELILDFRRRKEREKGDESRFRQPRQNTDESTRRHIGGASVVGFAT
ncbi:hypothetical protein Cni_G28961 [Canna indica]|uniref:Uncharacterized protein n=1 Tax=Canna indica TaxID=4628 RepID=A0AAQ3QQR5_9LILI|nr:hypothetical protein Cni_G28961 [Canna indica]